MSEKDASLNQDGNEATQETQAESALQEKQASTTSGPERTAAAIAEKQMSAEAGHVLDAVKEHILQLKLPEAEPII